jgi:hypothetical protein
MEAQLSNLDNLNSSLLISWQQAQALLYRFFIDYDREGIINCYEEDIYFFFEDVLNHVTFGSLILPTNDLFYDEIRKLKNLKNLINLIEYQQKEPIRQLIIYIISDENLAPDQYEEILIEIESFLSKDCSLRAGLCFDDESNKNELRILFSFI